MNELKFHDLTIANRLRADLANHPINSWSITDWTNAMAGETGEACNVAKKIKRLDSPQSLFQTKRGVPIEELKSRLAEELADMVIYADLAAQRMGIKLGDAVVEKFNKVSDEIGVEVHL